VAYAFLSAIDGWTLVRGPVIGRDCLSASGIVRSPPSRQIRTEVQERISFVFGQTIYVAAHLVGRISLPTGGTTRPLPAAGFSVKSFPRKALVFHRNFDAARTAASLIESIQKFRQVMEASGDTSIEVGREYLAMLQDGVIAAQYIEAWQAGPAEAVLIAPAHTFLMMNQPAAVQFWLDVGSNGWWERLFQPLTQPYVLSRSWQASTGSAGRLWTDADDLAANQQALSHLVTGLLRRCSGRIYLGMTEPGRIRL